MNGLGKYCHDFPRLAKESGYTFQLYRGRINWSDLDKLNVQEIIDERNFQLLEQNLIHVINCNLEREYDLKILDQNFVKLFKLAQLGIDYLSYCELYLDRCVILLQEQLASYQEECNQLKDEIERKDEELKKMKKKAKLQSQNYKCTKCNKIFLNEIYLESHEKRRHRNASETNENKRLNYTDQAQQTDTRKKSISVFTQTVDNKTPLPGDELQASDKPEKLRSREEEIKIDNLKRDLEDLKIRLSITEKTMEEKKNDERTYSSSFPSAVIPIIHSYISPTYNGQVPVISAAPTLVPGIHNKLIVREEVDSIHDTINKAIKPEHNEISMNSGTVLRQTSAEEIPQHKSSSPERVPAEGASTIGSGSINSNEIFPNIDEGLKEEKSQTPPQRPFVNLDNQIVNVRSKSNIKQPLNAEINKNLPKKSKSDILLNVGNLVNDLPETSLPISSVSLLSDLKIESESPSESLEPRTSTPVRVISEEMVGENETKLDSEQNALAEKREHMRKSQEILVLEPNSFDGKEKSKSLLRKIVNKKSPKIQELTVNLKNSLSQLYGSVSSVGKKNPDLHGAIAMEKSKSHIVEGLHKRLRELGIDPEWSGIPKETMKQKLNILEHHRNIVNRESRMYPYLRRKLQKHVIKKLKSNSQPFKGKAQFLEQRPLSDMVEPSGTTSGENFLLNETNEITIYDTDRDSDVEEIVTKASKQIPSVTTVASGPSNKSQNISLDSIEPIESAKMTLPGDMKWGAEERKTTDFSIFQAGKFKSSKMTNVEFENCMGEKEKLIPANIIDEQETDSDFADDLFEELGREIVQYGPDKSPRKDTVASFPTKSEDNTLGGSSRNAITGGQSILKSEMENKPQLMSKKKVLFAEEPEIFESTSKGTKITIEKQKIFDLSSAVDGDDDDWSIENEWIVNKAH